MQKKRGRSIRRKCKKSKSGKHEPRYVYRDGMKGDERNQVCKHCGKRLRRWKIGW